MGKIEFKILLRSPKFPIVVFLSRSVQSAFGKKELASLLVNADEGDINDDIIKGIDSMGEEFWYSPSKYVLSPGFTLKKLTKKQIIERYNSSSNVISKALTYNPMSLSNKRLDALIRELCDRIKAE